MASLFIKRGTRAQLNAAAAAAQLRQGEPYLITDEARLAIGLTTSTYQTYATQSEASAAPALTHLQASLGANVQMPTSSVWVNGPSLLLDAGIWLVNANAQFVRNSTGATQWSARLAAGVVSLSSGQQFSPSLSGVTARISLSAVITLLAPTTVILQGMCNPGATTCLMSAATVLGGSGTATNISALRIA